MTKTLLNRLKPVVSSDIFFAAALVFIWHLLLTVAGYWIDTSSLTTTGLFDHIQKTILGHTIRWDAGWYAEIIRSDFYQHTSSQGAIFAFYPLYPLLTYTLSVASLSLLSIPAASLLVNTIASFFAILALLRIVQIHTKNSRLARLLPVVLLASPAAFFLHVFYSEAVFIAVAFWAYLFALKRQWLPMAILLAILTAARLPSILFVALCCMEYLRAHKWKLRSILESRTTLLLLLTPLGFMTYGAWCYLITGDALAMFHAYKASDGWPYQVFDLNIFRTIFHSIAISVQSVAAGTIGWSIIVNHILPLGAMSLLFASSMWLVIAKRSAGMPLAVFGVLAAVMFSLNSNLVSVHRYALACVPIFIGYALVLERYQKLQYANYLLIPGMLVIQASLYVLFITGNFAG